MTSNAASRLRSLEDRSAALGSSRCELPVMHSVPKSAVLPYASGVGGLSRRLLNRPKHFTTTIVLMHISGYVEYRAMLLARSQAFTVLGGSRHVACVGLTASA